MVTDDPIGRMFKRGQLRRKTAQDEKTAEARLRATRMWQSIYADLPGTQLRGLAANWIAANLRAVKNRCPFWGQGTGSRVGLPPWR